MLSLSFLVVVTSALLHNVAARTMVKRVNGNVNFQQNWAAYEDGFGDCKTGDCWMGLESLHKMCAENCKLKIKMTFEGQTYHSDYTTFKIGPKSDNYRMLVGGYSGDGYDHMAISNSMQFSTMDRDNDAWWGFSCAHVYTGGWWYKGCSDGHPTGTWGSTAYAKGINWKMLTGYTKNLASIIMDVEGPEHIMLQRVRANVDFHEMPSAYEKGFGDCKTGDCWMGLESLHTLCAQNCKLRITMSYKGQDYHADYTTFRIGPKSDKYRLTVGGYSGNAKKDEFSSANNMQFSVMDRDNDKWEKNCAATYTGGWWYNACHSFHPTGRLDRSGTGSGKKFGVGVNWSSITTLYDTLYSITMKVSEA